MKTSAVKPAEGDAGEVVADRAEGHLPAEPTQGVTSAARAQISRCWETQPSRALASCAEL